MPTKYVKVPDEFAPMFEEAEEVVSRYFQEKMEDPTKGIIKIGDDRYVLIRAESMSIRFIDQMSAALGEDAALNFLYSFAKIIGRNDARDFHEKRGLIDPIQKLSAGPVHFSFTGWALVDILPESAPAPDESYFLMYDHPNTFEADSYLKHGRKTTRPVCVFSAGYSAGWCSESFGLNLDAREISCRARGDGACRFIMAPAERIEEHVRKHSPGGSP